MNFQRGIGLIEVLVALLLLAVAVLGFSAMQLQSVRSTAEAVDRSQALQLMRGLAEKIRANPEAMTTYAAEMDKIAELYKNPNSSNYSAPTEKCLSSNTSSEKCNPKELARVDVFHLKQQLDSMGIGMNMAPCPGTGGGNTNNVMFSYCLITAWGRTTPTIGNNDKPSATDGFMDCLSTQGLYHPQASCMYMEVN